MTESRPLTDVCWSFSEPLIGGRLVRRYKRFLADVELDDGVLATVHCPNSGSMLGCLEIGARVYCSPSAKPGRRTAYTWEMIHVGEQWIGINTAIPNELIAQAARMQAHPIFHGATRVAREVSIGSHTRFDMVVESETGCLYVEVKNVTLVRSGEAHFPDAVTARGAKHLEQLMALIDAGHAAAMVYVVQRQDAQVFGPAEDIDANYTRLYREARAKGVVMVAVEARVSPQAICLVRELPLLL
jgi:sugar fermentation stimulation protein A